MFKQIFRLTFATFIWKQYKRIIVSTLLLFAYLWLVGSIHSDYLSYAELQTDQSMAGSSFLLKWAALVVGVMLYLVYNFMRGAKRNNSNNSTSSAAEVEPASQSQTDQDDPFTNIRKMKKLRTRAEISIAQQLNNKARK